MDQKVFKGAVNFESKPNPAVLGASIGFLSAILIHFDEVPTTAENLIITYINENDVAYTTELYNEDPATKSLQDHVLQWGNGFLLDAGDAIKITYPNTDARKIGITVKYRYF